MWLFILALVSQVLADQTLVDTPKGPIKGRSEGNYTTFFGIPYARVDEDNPFGETTPHPNFVEPFEAFDGSTECPQMYLTAEGILQCLHLNIYVPQRRDNQKLPVFVWFHGGGFVVGNGGENDGRYLVQHNIIVITANYRLGPYGFFCLNDPQVPGNQGLKDQTEALKWVRDNIHSFGGDADKVTIAGESYGGGAVDLHLYSNYDKYFDKAIVQSGGARVEGMFVKPDHNAPLKLAKLLDHVTTDNRDALKFLAKVDPLELIRAFNRSGMSLGACKEKKFANVQSFLTEDPFRLLKPNKIKDTPIIFGYTSKEMFGSFVNESEQFYESKKDIFFEKLNRTFNLEQKNMRNLADVVKRFYFGSKPVKKENMLYLVDFTGDYCLNFAAENSVTRLVEQGAKVYKYVFSYVGNSEFKNVSGVGSDHTEELQYLFHYVGEELVDPEHVMMRDRMTTLWANFVKYGDPTPETSTLLPVTWTAVPKDSRPYMNIDLEMSMMQDIYHDRVAFWELLWNTYWRHSRIIS